MSLLDILCCFPSPPAEPAPQPRGKLIISQPTLIHGGEATRSLNLVDVKEAAASARSIGSSSSDSSTAGSDAGGGPPPIQKMSMRRVEEGGQL